MTLLKIKLKNDSEKDFITTNTGYTIDKKGFTLVKSDDYEIERLIYNREDLDVVACDEKFESNIIGGELFKE